MATAVRSYQSTDVSVGDITKAVDHNTVRDDIEMAFTEYDYGDTADLPGSPTLGQKFMDKEADVLYGCFDAGTWGRISPHWIIGGAIQVDAGSAIYAGGFGTPNQHVTIGYVEQAAPYDCTFDRMYIEAALAPGDPARNFVVTLYVNGVAKALTVTLNDSETDGNDVTNSVDVTAGQRVAVLATTSGGSPASNYLLHTMRCSSKY